jgi:hypothetical protein
MRLNRLVFLALACTPCFAAAQKVTLRLNPPAGRTYVYRATTKSENKTAGMDMSMDQTYTMSMKVLSNKGGKVTFQSKVSDIKIKTPPNSPMAGSAEQIKKMMEGMAATSTVDSRYRMVSMKNSSTNPMVQGMAQGISGAMSGMTTFPEGPVGVGSSWTSKLDMGKMMSGQMMPGGKVTSNIPITLTVLRFTTVAGKKCVELSMKMGGTMHMTMGGQGGGKPMQIETKMSGKGTMLMDLATGMFLRMNSTSTSTTLFGSQSMNSTQTMSMALKN